MQAGPGPSSFVDGGPAGPVVDVDFEPVAPELPLLEHAHSPTASAASRLDATSSGWAIAVSRIVSASALVP